MSISADVQRLEPGAIVQLFELDVRPFGGQLMRFHGYTQNGSVMWQGNEYNAYALEADGFAKVGNALQPAPTLLVSNVGGGVSALCLAHNDLVGVRLTRKRTLGQYLDGQPTADPAQHFPDEIWLVEAKTREDREVCEFELRSALDFDGQQLPARQITANMCTWLSIGGYRGPYCNYTGSAKFDVNDNPVLDPAADKCGGRVRSCKLRFGEDHVINFGGFPAADMLRG